MSITIYQEPQAWAPAFNDQWILAKSTEIAQPNFKYHLVISINYYPSPGATIDLAEFTYDILPRPDGYMVHNCKEAVKDFIQNYFKPDDWGVIDTYINFVTVSIAITETWDGEAGTGLEETGYSAWNASLLQKQVHLGAYDYADWVSDGEDVKIHAVNNNILLPDSRVTMKTDVFLQFVMTTGIKKIIYYVIDTNGTDITDSKEYDTSLFATGHIYQINISPQLAVSESFTISEDYYVLVQFFNSTDDVIQEYQYRISDLCTKHEVKRIYYLNRQGGISYMHFEMQSQKSGDMVTNTVRQNTNEIVSDTWTSKPYKHEVQTVSTQIKLKESLSTDWITKEQSDALEELWSSPLKWLVSEEDDFDDPFKFKPVTITDKGYQFKKHENEKLFQYTVNVEYSVQETRQRG